MTKTIVALLALVTGSNVFGIASGQSGSVYVEAKAPISSRPLTLKVSDSPELKAILRSVKRDLSQHVRLTATGLQPSAKGAGVRVFLGLPDDQKVPSVDSENYLGTFSFFGAKEGVAEDTMLDATPVLRKLLDAKKLSIGRDLGITLVAVPIRPGDSIDGMNIPLKGVSLELVEPDEQ